MYVKGAVDLLLPLCVAGTEGALEKNTEYSKRGLRVLAIAKRNAPPHEESGLTLVGLLGSQTPPT